VLARQEITREDMERWHAILNEKGWLAGPWPKEFGGRAWGPVEAHIFEEECCRAGAPRIVPFGIKMLGPVLMKFGSPEQQAEYLPRILDGTRLVVPGLFGAGRGLGPGQPEDEGGARRRPLYRQRAEDMDDAWPIRQPHLLPRAHEARGQAAGGDFLPSDRPRHARDRDAAHPTDRRRLRGERGVLHRCRVPVANLVGAENEGWTIAKYLLGHERTNIAGVGFSMQALEQVKSLARTVRRNGKPLIQNTLFAARIARWRRSWRR
jgi:alkylation response protein AidB-like acyl-CoA dehydrogenase